MRTNVNLLFGLGLILLFLVSSCGSSPTREKQGFLLRKIIENSEVKSELFYNLANKPERWNWYMGGGKLAGYDLFVYENGFLVKTESYNADKKLFRYTVFKYDDENRLIKSEYYSSENLSEKDADGAELRQTLLAHSPLTRDYFYSKLPEYSRAKSGTPLLSGSECYKYDELGHLSIMTFYDKDSKEIASGVFENDEKGNRITETWVSQKMPDMVAYRCEYEYDNKNSAIKNVEIPTLFPKLYGNNVIRSTNIETGQTESYSYTYKYNDKNFPVSSVITGSEGEQAGVIEYIYN